MHDFILNSTENLAVVRASGIIYLTNLKRAGIFRSATGKGHYECKIGDINTTVFKTVMIDDCIYDKNQFLLKYT